MWTVHCNIYLYLWSTMKRLKSILSAWVVEYRMEDVTAQEDCSREES